MKNSFLILIVLFLVSGLSGQTATPISAVQGDGYYSPLADKNVTVKGIVTGIRKRGFYIQTPDDEVDADPKTSEGIFIFTLDTPDSEIAVGKLVEVTGKVTEFKPKREKYSLFLTEIVEPKTKILSDENTLPAPVLITSELLTPKGQIDQLERFEGMRVKIDDLLVVSPTGGFYDKKEDLIKSDGAFYGVLANTQRPFREPGLDALKVLIDKLPQEQPVFDMNPELIRIDSDELKGSSPIDVTSGASVKNIVGIVDYHFKSYTVLVDPEPEPTVTNLRKFVPASAAGDREITIASFNLENFFDDEENSDLGSRKETMVSSTFFEKRLKKASLAIRNVVGMPDILGIVEVENLTVLKKLAARINADAVAADQPDPKYEAILEESNDIRGIDVGFLVKSAKVKAVKSELLGKDLKHDHTDANPEETLFSRPPFLAEFQLTDESESFPLTVIVNHFKSYRGVESSRVQNKKRAQAEFLAEFVSERQKTNPEEKIILIGDFNAFQFPDGYNDQIGTLKGKPSKNVLMPAQNTFATGLINLVEYIKESNRYSYIFGGSAQTLDHILINRPTRKHAAKFGYARLNADFPKSYANDETRPERLSDHDVPVLYLKLGDKKESKEAPTPAPVEDTPISAKPAALFDAFLFYSFDRKDAELPDSELTIGNWLDFKTKGFSQGSPDGNLFERKGGGPNGAEWNPDGSLYIALSLNTPAEPINPALKLNGESVDVSELVSKTSEDGNLTYYWIELPAASWKSSLREIQESDVAELFGKDIVDKKDDSEESIPLTTGKIIVIELTLGNETITKYFHAAFGE